jgi:hypothetical protein
MKKGLILAGNYHLKLHIHEKRNFSSLVINRSF